MNRKGDHGAEKERCGRWATRRSVRLRRQRPIQNPRSSTSLLLMVILPSRRSIRLQMDHTALEGQQVAKGQENPINDTLPSTVGDAPPCIKHIRPSGGCCALVTRMRSPIRFCEHALGSCKILSGTFCIILPAVAEEISPDDRLDNRREEPSPVHRGTTVAEQRVTNSRIFVGREGTRSSAAELMRARHKMQINLWKRGRLLSRVVLQVTSLRGGDKKVTRA